MLRKKIFLVVALISKNMAATSDDYLDVVGLLRKTEQAALLGNGEAANVSLDDLPSELVGQLKELAQQLDQDEKDRHRERMYRAVVCAVTAITIVLIRVYREKYINSLK